MEPEATRRAFLQGGTLATAGLLAGAVSNAGATEQPDQPQAGPDHQHDGHAFPRDRPGPGGPVGSATDRGKLVPGRRGAGDPPPPVVTPDLPKLPWKMVGGVKEFHLVAKHTK